MKNQQDDIVSGLLLMILYLVITIGIPVAGIIGFFALAGWAWRAC
jgi:hypothetical protein